MELRWTEPRIRERWNPCKTRTMEGRPSQYDATRKADVSTRLGLRLLHWSRHIARSAKTSCPRYCFKVTPLRHRLDCFTFSADLFSPSNDLQRYLLNRGIQCPRLDPCCDDNTVSFDENSGDSVNAGEWPNSRRDALATSIVCRLPLIVSLCGTRDTTLETARVALV